MDSIDLLSVTEIADRLKVPKKTIYNWVSQHSDFPSIKVGRHRRFIFQEVLDYFRQKTLETKPCFVTPTSIKDTSSKRRSLKIRATGLAETEKE